MSEPIQFPLITESRRDEMYRQFQAFHAEHPEVWQMFVEFTLDRIGKGFKHYGAGAIFERIRWESAAGADGKTQFKLNNNYRAFYSRSFERAFPEHRGFFRKRTQLSDLQVPSYLPPLKPSDYSDHNS